MCLTTEAVQGAALALEGVHHVQGSDGLAASVLGVGDGVTDDVLQEHFQYTTGLLVDETRDALDAASAGKTADRGLGDALDVIAENLSVTLGAALAETLSSSFSSSRHVEVMLKRGYGGFIVPPFFCSFSFCLFGPF